MAELFARDDFQDELFNIDYLNQGNEQQMRRVVFERGDPFNDLNDRKFRERYRLSKPTVLSLVEQLNERLEYPTQRNHPISPMNRVLTTLRYYATGAFNIVIGDAEKVHRTTAIRIIHSVSAAIASMSNTYINFPMTQAEEREVMEGFSRVHGFPGVIGAIDCTHIRIKSPGGANAELFRNRKGYFSINCQTSDSNLLIRDIVARWPGSVHDSTIFRNCAKRAEFHNGVINNGFLLGDGGYACQPYLLTPVLNPQTQAERTYNYAHARTRNKVERQYGVWKRRFPVLSIGLRCEVHKTLTIIVATAVLHNIAIATREKDPPDDIELTRLLQELRQIRGPDIEDDEPPHPDHLMYRNDNNTGRAVRQALITNYFNNQVLR